MKSKQMGYTFVVIIIILVITMSILIVGINGSLVDLRDTDGDGIPNILDGDDDGDGVNDQDDYDPLDPNVTDPPDDDDDDDPPTNSTDWVTIQLFIQEYNEDQPNTPGNPSYYILSISGDSYTYVEWVDLELGGPMPPYEWRIVVHKNIDGSLYDPYSEWGELSYDGGSDTWVDSSNPGYLDNFGEGSWNTGDPSLVFNDAVCISDLSGHYVCFDFYVCGGAYAYWDYYVTFQVP